MLIRLRSTGEVIADTAFLLLHDNVSFPHPLRQQDIDAFDADIVLDDTPPQAGQFQSVVADGFEQVDGQWFTKFKLIDWAQEQIDAYLDFQKLQIYAERNKLLSECDWTQAKDIPDSISIPWAIYRQALRDISDQAEFPLNIQWPSKPE